MVSNILVFLFLGLIISLATSYHVEAEKEAEAAFKRFHSEHLPLDHARTLLIMTKNFIVGLSQISPYLLGLIIISAVIGLTPMLIFFSILITLLYTA